MRSAHSSQQSFSIEVAPERRRVVVIPSGDLDIASVDAFEREVQRQSRTGAVQEIVIDLRRVTFMDASGLGALISLRNAARRRRRTFILIPGRPIVQRLFDLTATRSLFDWQLRVVDESG